MIMGRQTKNTGSLSSNLHTVRESHQTLASKKSKPTLNLLPPLQSTGSVKQLLSYPKAVIVEERNTTIGVKSNPPQASKPTPPLQRKLIFGMSSRQRVDNGDVSTTISVLAPVASVRYCLSDNEDDSSDDEADDVSTTISIVLAPVASARYCLSDNEDDSSDVEADDVSTTISIVLAPVASTRYCLSDNEDESASSDDDADDESKLFGEDVENDSLVYSVSDSDSIAVSDSDSIDVFLDNESSDSDLDTVVKESSVVEMVDHHSCDKLIGTIVIVDDLMEDWKPEAEKDDASMDDVENWKPKAEKDDASMDDVAVSDSDSIDVFLDNESSDSDLDSVVKESSVVEMVDHHSCDKLIGTIVIVDDLMEDMDWEPLPLRRSPRLAALRESLSRRPLRRSQRLAVLYNGR